MSEITKPTVVRHPIRMSAMEKTLLALFALLFLASFWQNRQLRDR